MEENRYRIYYKNGNSIECEAYYMEIVDGNLYQSCKAGWGNDAPVLSVINGSKIDRVECIEKRS